MRARHWKRRLTCGHTRESLSHPHALGQVLAVALIQHGLVVKQVQLRRTARHEKENDIFGKKFQNKNGSFTLWSQDQILVPLLMVCIFFNELLEHL